MLNWRLITTVAHDFWRRLPERPRELHDYLAQYLRLRPLMADASYRLLRGWRLLHHLLQLAAAQADAEFFGTQLATHATAYKNLRRQRATFKPSASSPEVVAAPEAEATPVPPPDSRLKGTTLTDHELRTMRRVFRNAEAGKPLQSDEVLDGYSTGDPLYDLRQRRLRRKQTPTAVTS